MPISAQDLHDAAFLANSAYLNSDGLRTALSETRRGGLIASSWQELGSDELPAPPGLPPLRPWDTWFGEGDGDSNFLFDNGNVQGFIARSGSTIAIVFRGADGVVDNIQNIIHGAAGFAAEYHQFDNLIESLRLYIAEQQAVSSITKILVAGHSLGGAMAELFMAAHPPGGNVEYVGITFASPSDGSLAGVNDPRLVNFGNLEDPVANSTQGWELSYRDVGVDVTHVTGHDLSASGLILLAVSAASGYQGQHAMSEYWSTARAIALSSTFDQFLANPDNYNVVVGSPFRSNTLDATTPDFTFDLILGGDYADYMRGFAGEDLLDGARGNDVISGGDHNDWIDGGRDYDTVQYVMDRVCYDIAVSGNVVTITPRPDFSQAEGTDTIRNVEAFVFNNGAPIRFDDLLGRPSPTPPPSDPPPSPPPSLTPPAPTSDDLPDNQYTSARIALSAAGFGAMHGYVEQAKDSDWFRIDLVAGRTYRIDVFGESSLGASSYFDNTFFRVRHESAGFDTSGRPKPVPQFSDLAGTAWDDAGIGSDAQATYTAPVSGQYYISIGGGGPNGVWDTVTGEYWVMVADITAGQPANQAPIAVADSFAVKFGQTIQANVLADQGQGFGPDRDPDGSLLTVDVVSGHRTAAGGIVDLLANGAFQYIAPAGGAAAVSDSFTYTLRDGAGGVATGIVTINISPLSGAFTEGDDVRTLPAGGGTWHALGGVDLVYGSLSAESIFGGAGDDRLLMGGGNDFIDGGPGSDQLRGGAGDDWIVSDGSDSYITGDDFPGTLPGTDHDTLEFVGTAGGIVADWFGGRGTPTEGIEVLIATDFADELAGHDVADNVFYGRGGNDRIRGWGGDDTLLGGSGNDDLNGDNGDDHLFGNEDQDEMRGGAGRDFLDGGAGDDELDGGEGDDVLIGGDGTDEVIGGIGSGRDYFIAGAGDDRLLGLDGIDTVDYSLAPDGITGGDRAMVVSGWGTSSLDTIEIVVATSLDDNFDVNASVYSTVNEVRLGAGGDWLRARVTGQFFGEEGNDLIFAFAGGQAFGGSGNDQLIVFGNDSVEFFGESGDDGLFGGGGLDLLDGGEGNDTLGGGSNDDMLFGDSGDDTLDGGTGADTISGGAGNDTYVVDDPGDGVVEGFGEGTDTVQTTRSVYSLTDNVESLTFTGAGNFTGVGNVLGNVLTGGAGDDQLIGGAGADTFVGGDGADNLFIDEFDTSFAGGDNADFIIVLGAVGVNIALGGTAVEFFQGSNTGGDTVTAVGATYLATMYGLSGNDSLTGSDFGDYLLGGFGDDTLTGNGGADALHGSEGNDTISGDDGADVLVGLDGDDHLSGGNDGDTIIGGIGADDVSGGAGNDQLFGSDGNDGMEGGDGVDFLDGGSGDDVMHGGTGGDGLHGLDGNDTMFGDDGADVLVGYAGIDTMSGGAGGDTILGGDGSDTLNGDDGNDQMFGHGDDDIMNGGAGADFLAGGLGNEVMNGGADGDYMTGEQGNDTMTGGAGGDLFLMQNGFGNDIVTDFEAGVAGPDLIDVTSFAFGSFANLMAVTTDTAGGALIQLDANDSILLQGVLVSQLHSGDFLI